MPVEDEAKEPRVAVLMLTPACNMQCGFCGAWDGFEPMGWAQAVELLKDLKARGCTSVVLGGGEPFLWSEDPVELARVARSLGLHVQAGSNGTGPKAARNLRAFDRWVLPLESMDPAVHDAMRPLKGRSHFEAVLSLMEDLRRERVELTLSSLVSHENALGLAEVGRYLRDYRRRGGRIHAWHLYRFLPLGRGGARNALRFLNEPDAFENAGSLLKWNFPDLRLHLRGNMYRSRQVSFHWSRAGRLRSQGGSLAGGDGLDLPAASMA